MIAQHLKVLVTARDLIWAWSSLNLQSGVFGYGRATNNSWYSYLVTFFPFLHYTSLC